jgi:hypothetical protein
LKDEWDDFDAMMVDIGKRVRGKMFCADDLTDRCYGFTDGVTMWRIRVSKLPWILAKIEDPKRREILRRAFSTAAGRRAFAESVPKVLLQSRTRFNRDDVI